MGVVRRLSASAAVLALSAGLASAATVTINISEWGSIAGGDLNVAGAVAARDAFIGGAFIVASEDFEGYTACPAAGCSATPLVTPVGTFTGLPPAGLGTSPVPPTDQAVVRSSGTNIAGRFNVDPTPGGSKWLDSNDQRGILWETASAGMTFTRLAFFLTDANDAGDIDFMISVAGQALGTGQISGFRPNGTLHLITMSFSQSVQNVSIRFMNADCPTPGPAGECADGFGIDGIVAAIPVPAPALLLLTGLGALGGVAAIRRRRETAA